MFILDAAKRRYATKAFKPDQKIPEADIKVLQTIVQLSPSSINIQPWHVFLASSDTAKKKILPAVQGPYDFNEQKILDASHIMVFCACSEINDTYLEKLLAKEKADGRLVDEKTVQLIVGVRNAFLASVKKDPNNLKCWVEKQLYIALGNVLLAASAMQIDSVPIEGFNAAILDEQLGLNGSPYHSVVMAAFGYHSDADFNANLVKSRFNQEDIFTEL